MKKSFLWIMVAASLALAAAGIFTWGIMEGQRGYDQSTGEYILERLGLKSPLYEYLTAQELSNKLKDKHGMNGLTLKYAFDVDSYALQAKGLSDMQFVLISDETGDLLSAKIAVREDRKSPLLWYYYTFDKRNMRLLVLEDLFDTDSDYMSVIEQEVLDALYRSYEKGVKYYVGATGEIQLCPLRFDRRFYVKNDELIFAFAPYEISPDGKWHEVGVKIEVLQEYMSVDFLSRTGVEPSPEPELPAQDDATR